MSDRERILKNIAQWKKEQQRKAHMNDADCPVDNTHVVRAKETARAVEEWMVEQKKRWANTQKRNAELTFKPFRF
jgi:L-lactate utilization protein LutC